MNRRQLAFIVTLNAVVSLAIAILVNWVAELRRPDPEELAALVTPVSQVILAATPASDPAVGQIEPTSAPSVPQPEETPTNSGPALTGNEEIYTVQSGDSLSSIAGRFNVTVNELMAANKLDNPDFVFVGQQLVVLGSNANAQSTQNSTSSAAATSTPAQQGVVISEVTGGGAAETELILLVNESNSAVDLRGWTLGREGGAVYTFGSVNLFPGSSVRLHTGVGESNSVDLYWGREEPAWLSGSVVRLVNGRGELVSSYTVP